MENTKHTLKLLACLGGLFFLFSKEIKAQSTSDSLKIKLPRHYFNTVIVVDAYRKPEKTFKDTSDVLSKHLKSYGIKQFSLAFHVPLFTKEKSHFSIIKNTHLLLTGNFLSLRPVFDGLSQHNLIKFGVGLRYIYNNGRKGVWFVDVSPFVTRDIAYPSSKPYYRMASTIIYSHNVNEKFNWRLGATKSFMWGNRLYLPFVGLRVGRLDKVNLSLQFPRSLSLNVPIGSKLIFSLYTRPQGGMFNFSNADSLYFNRNSETFHFTRYEINSGLRFDVRLSSHFNFYIASGISSRNNITFYSDNANKRKASYYNKYFYSKNVAPTLYFNFGLVLKFGKARSFYNNKNMYDAIDLNNTNGLDNGNAQIPLAPIRKSDFNLKSVEDLVDYNDF